jgi:hypothetical protein
LEFENAPDEGFFGKGFVRPFNLAWNYICKGFVGTCATFVLHPILGILNAVLSVGLILVSPVWAFAGAFGMYLLNVFLYDTCPYYSWLPFVKHLFYDIIIKGLGQIIITPVFATGVSLFGIGAYTLSFLRYIY